MNSEYSQKLGELREEIDKIDDKILKLLQKRLEIVKSVQEVKSKNGEEFFIKSAREADMIKNLLTKTKIMPKSAIIDIWRKIITSANCLEQPLQIALHNPNHITDFKYILRQYYADFVPIINQNNIADVIFDIEKNKS
ncbi:MAG TPA: chorismate mutase, partial [Rickettsiales bacterium]|nr:chorismate mutase [Rickettsiales bacterium]